MTPDEAMMVAMDEIDRLRDEGIEVEIKAYDLDSDCGKSAMKEYGKLEKRASPEMWRKVKFKVRNDEESRKISESARYLGMAGVSFDCGGCCGYRDWELDWSFKYNRGESNDEWRENVEEIEDIICNLPKEKMKIMRTKPKREDYPIGFGGDIGFNGAMLLWKEQQHLKS